MTNFPNIVLIRINESFNLYEVYEVCEAEDSEVVIKIPKGFVTDFASIPRFLWSILPPHGAAMPPSVLHDYFYTVHPLCYKYNTKEERQYADRWFRALLIESGISKFQAEIMYSPLDGLVPTALSIMASRAKLFGTKGG